MEAAGGIDARRRQMLAENRANSANLRDLLRIKQDDNSNRSNVSNNNGNNLVGLTLGAVLSGDLRSTSMPAQQNRTLFDIIRDEPVGKNVSKDGKKSWKLLKKKLKLRRAGSGSAWTSSVPIPASDVPLHQNNDRVMTRRHSTGFISSPPGSTQQPETEPEPSSSSSALSAAMMRSSSSLQRNADGETTEAVDRVDREESLEVENGGGGGEEQPVRMSLMALLEETDRQMGFDGPVLIGGDSDDSDEEAAMDGGESGGTKVEEYNSCCVCMVRTKGAAFIPCGHTFCRLCSRELWVQRGNCPLCNNFILEILDLF